MGVLGKEHAETAKNKAIIGKGMSAFSLVGDRDNVEVVVGCHKARLCDPTPKSENRVFRGLGLP